MQNRKVGGILGIVRRHGLKSWRRDTYREVLLEARTVLCLHHFGASPTLVPRNKTDKMRSVMKITRQVNKTSFCLFNSNEAQNAGFKVQYVVYKMHHISVLFLIDACYFCLPHIVMFQ